MRGTKSGGVREEVLVLQFACFCDSVGEVIGTVEPPCTWSENWKKLGDDLQVEAPST